MSEPCIHILMACYNGEEYIAEQIDSILQQTYINWRLTIRDDGSKDNTIAIVKTYIHQYPQQIFLLSDDAGNVGSALNFSLLLQQAKDDKYIMFCDQDDKWMPDKIEITYRRMLAEEIKLTRPAPALVFTNFQYCDNNLQPIESKQDFKVNNWEKVSFSHLLAQNPVYGCTTMINRALVDKVRSIPREAENHDYWIALVASFTGNIFYLDKKTVSYRQHGQNISGSHDNDSLQKRFTRIALQKGNVEILRKKKRMLEKLGELYDGMMTVETKKTLADFLFMYQKKSALLFYKNYKNGVICQTASQTALLYYSFLLYKNEEQ